MPWFSKPREADPWEEQDDALVGDIDLAHKIRDICTSAESSTSKLAAFVNRPNDKIKKHETGRYDAAKKRALELAKQMSDELLRDTAVRQIVNLCMSANDVETAARRARSVRYGCSKNSGFPMNSKCCHFRRACWQRTTLPSIRSGPFPS